MSKKFYYLTLIFLLEPCFNVYAGNSTYEVNNSSTTSHYEVNTSTSTTKNQEINKQNTTTKKINGPSYKIPYIDKKGQYGRGK